MASDKKSIGGYVKKRREKLEMRRKEARKSEKTRFA